MLGAQGTRCKSETNIPVKRRCRICTQYISNKNGIKQAASASPRHQACHNRRAAIAPKPWPGV